MPICTSPFFIWFTGRTGSTHLCDLLDSHSQIYCRKEDFSEIRVTDDVDSCDSYQLTEISGELFMRRLVTPDLVIDDASPQQAVEHLDQVFSSSARACGFKLKFPNQPIVYPEIADKLRSMKPIKVIQLVRENVLKQAISLRNVARLQQSGSFQSGNAMVPVELEPLHLDVDLAVKHARYFLRSRDEFCNFANSFSSVLHLKYEQLHSNLGETLTRILEFLDVDPTEKLESRFQKTTPDKIRDAVSNYDELVAAVTGSELEQFLD